MTWLGTLAELLVAFGTLVVAAVAVFQETIRAWFYQPCFSVSVKTEPPDCVWAPFKQPNGTLVCDSVYLRLWIENKGNATARNVEVYAKGLRRRRADNTWERVAAFPPMNLKWANLLGGQIYFPIISPEMGKHCDVAHVADAANRAALGETPPAPYPTNRTAMAFDLMVAPDHRGHIVGLGEYELEVLVAAENARPLRKLVKLGLTGDWHADEQRMLRDGFGIAVEDP